MPDLELEAMTKISDALSGLDAIAAARVLRWAADRYGVNIGVKLVAAEQLEDAPQVAEFADFASLYDVTNPQVESDKALVAGYWFQQHQKTGDWDGFSINTALKNLGHPLTNVTRALDDSMKTSPRLVMQTMKSGSSKQARKKYRLTKDGISYVRGMISGQRDES